MFLDEPQMPLWMKLASVHHVNAARFVHHVNAARFVHQATRNEVELFITTLLATLVQALVPGPLEVVPILAITCTVHPTPCA